MIVKVLGASSKGNCYLLENDTECLVIDAGISLKEVKKVLDFNISKVVGVVVTHSHNDHAKHISEYEKQGIKIFKPYEKYSLVMEYGGFTITAFELVHDVPCYGFLIAHSDIGRLIYATDTEYIKYRFKNIDHVLIECNHSKELLHQSTIRSLGERVMSSHMELETCKGFILANQSDRFRNIILMHLSDSNSDEKFFKKEIEQLVNCSVYIAEKGLEVDLSQLPF
jgi:phosphoribosyl 1,2-cyclic phosphodiesterase